jgi:hypothetical protein
MFPRFESALLAAAVVLIADSVPTFDVESFCRRVEDIAGSAYADVCMRKEQEARDQLAQQWARFPAADRSFCRQLSTTGGDPTYTELLTCLELQRDARDLREKGEGTSGTSPRF